MAISLNFPGVMGSKWSLFATYFHFGLIWGQYLEHMLVIYLNYRCYLPFTCILREVYGLLYSRSTGVAILQMNGEVHSFHMRYGSMICNGRWQSYSISHLVIRTYLVISQPILSIPKPPLTCLHISGWLARNGRELNNSQGRQQSPSHHIHLLPKCRDRDRNARRE